MITVYHWELVVHKGCAVGGTDGRVPYVTRSRKRGPFPQKFIRGYGCC